MSADHDLERLRAAAEQLEGESLPYLYGGDAVRWAEEILRQSAELDWPDARAVAPEKRLAPLRRIEERSRRRRKGGLLRWLLRAAKRLTNRA